MELRDCRYQAAIVRDGQILLVRHREHSGGRSYWVLPGGGRNAGESEESCVIREVLEETHLEVAVVALLLDQDSTAGIYRRYKTFQCRVLAGDARPGAEPEVEHSAVYEIAEAKWWSLTDPASWEPAITADAQTYSILRDIRAALGLP